MYRQDQKGGYKQKISPRMVMGTFVLKLPLMDLREYLIQEMNVNPVLEEDERVYQLGPERDDVAEWEYDESDPFMAPGEYLEPGPEAEQVRRYREELITSEETLMEHLLWQIEAEMEGKAAEIAEYVAGCLDESGYLSCPVEEIAEEFSSSVEDVESVLSRMRMMDPVGVASRDIRECLLSQLDSLGRRDSVLFVIVRDAFENLAEMDHEDIAEEYDLTCDEVDRYVSFLATLDPRPGGRFIKSRVQNIIPDVILRDTGNGYKVEINAQHIPELKISSFYADLLRKKGTDPNTKEYLRKKLEQARWLIDAVKTRYDTMKRISIFIVNAQKDFLDGKGELKPLDLGDVAEELNVSRSTVSRVVSSKYIQTSGGAIPLKKFFSRAVKTSSGGEVARRAVKTRIREILDESVSPLSDEKICRILKEEGIEISRRTVAKYRTQMNIISSQPHRKKEGK